MPSKDIDMTKYILVASSTLIEEFTIEANSKDEAIKKWYEHDYTNVEQTEINDPQVEEVREK